jgi:ribosomal protein L34E
MPQCGELKIFKERKPRVNTCGDCGEEIAAGAVLCEDCARQELVRWEPSHGLVR